MSNTSLSLTRTSLIFSLCHEILAVAPKERKVHSWSKNKLMAREMILQGGTKGRRKCL